MVYYASPSSPPVPCKLPPSTSVRARKHGFPGVLVYPVRVSSQTAWIGQHHDNRKGSWRLFLRKNSWRRHRSERGTAGFPRHWHQHTLMPTHAQWLNGYVSMRRPVLTTSPERTHLWISCRSLCFCCAQPVSSCIQLHAHVGGRGLRFICNSSTADLPFIPSTGPS